MFSTPIIDASCPKVGRNASRSITDIWGIVIFAICSILLLVVAGKAFHSGDVKILTHGTDYNGNICGQGYPKGLNISEEEWKKRTVLWFPFSFDIRTKERFLYSALKFPVCVEDCNPENDIVYTYGSDRADVSVPASFHVRFRTHSLFHRCIPYWGADEKSTHNYTACGNDSDCEKSLPNIKNKLGFNDFFFGLVTELGNVWWIILLLLLLTFVICCIWFYILRKIVKPMVIASLVLSAIFSVCVIVVCFARYSSLRNETDTKESENASFYLITGISTLIGLLIYLIVVFILRHKIMRACDVIQIASRVLMACPSLGLVPVMVTVAFTFILIFFGLIVVLLCAVREPTKTTVTTGVFGMTQKTYVVYTMQTMKGLVPAFLYVLFMLLWVGGAVIAFFYFAVSLTATQWFFSCPQEAGKVVGVRDLFWSIGVGLRYHLGTILGGSLLVALLRFLRILMKLFEKRIRKVTDSTSSRFLLCCCNCFLGCFERLLVFLTRHAYVVTGLEGKPLISGGHHAMSLLLANGTVVTVNFIGVLVIGLSKGITVAFMALVTYGVMHKRIESDNLLAVVLFALVGEYAICSSFSSIFSVCIDTVLLCYAYDTEQHDGAGSPYYSPNDLLEDILHGGGTDENRSLSSPTNYEKQV